MGSYSHHQSVQKFSFKLHYEPILVELQNKRNGIYMVFIYCFNLLYILVYVYWKVKKVNSEPINDLPNHTYENL